MNYRYLTPSVGGFIQQLAVCYLRRGYWFYVMGVIPPDKDPALVDRKLLEKYRIGLSKHQRYRRKQAGQANLQYLRHGRTFILVATSGSHPFFAEEQANLRDARRAPIRLFGYSLTVRNGRALVSLDPDTYRNLKARFLEWSVHRKAEALAGALRALPHEPYQPVYRQWVAIWKAVNERRRQAGHARVPFSCLRRKRRLYRPFEEAEPAGEAPALPPLEEGEYA